MSYWIFKLAEQELYPDIPGKEYVFDNTHSVRIQPGDIFLYLDKREGYAFTATGCIRRLSSRKPTEEEVKRTSKVRIVFTAHLADVIWFKNPFSISPLAKSGQSNRAILGITDVNLLGWSHSIPNLSEEMYQQIMDLVQADGLVLEPSTGAGNYAVDDAWSKTKVRKAIWRFTDEVLRRHKGTCVVCGISVRELVDAAHLSSYATDKRNRANPANGVCLCAFCHRAMDRRLIAICPTGELLVADAIEGPVAREHFTRIPANVRSKWLQGVDPEFLELTVALFRENSSNKKPEGIDKD